MLLYYSDTLRVYDLAVPSELRTSGVVVRSLYSPAAKRCSLVSCRDCPFNNAQDCGNPTYYLPIILKHAPHLADSHPEAFL